jgi:hypothetical protein
LKQDPRYFYQGTGNQKAAASPRAGKLARATMGAGTRITPACSANIAAGGISNLYYPSNDRNSAGVIFSTAFIRMGEIAVANIFQEFFIPKVTPTSLRELRSPETLRPSDKPNRPAIWLYSGRWQHTIPGSAPRRFAPWLPRPTAGGRSARAICADGEHPKSRAQTIQEVVALLTKVVIDGHISSRRLVGLGGISRPCSYFKDFFSLFPFSMFPSK